MNIANLTEQAEAGSVVAQCVLGICYLHGIDVDVNYKEAYRLLSAAAERRVPRALSNLGQMYFEGLGVAEDVPEALRLYHAAAEAGEFFAQIELARVYSRGEKVPADVDAALKWYSAAVTEHGSVEDCEEIREARRYIETRGNSSSEEG